MAKRDLAAELLRELGQDRTQYHSGEELSARLGVSRTADGLVGDVHPDVWEVAGHVSPNPGGVGPLTRAFLLTNVVELAERQ